MNDNAELVSLPNGFTVSRAVSLRRHEETGGRHDRPRGDCSCEARHCGFWADTTLSTTAERGLSKYTQIPALDDEDALVPVGFGCSRMSSRSPHSMCASRPQQSLLTTRDDDS